MLIKSIFTQFVGPNICIHPVHKRTGPQRTRILHSSIARGKPTTRWLMKPQAAKRSPYFFSLISISTLFVFSQEEELSKRLGTSRKLSRVAGSSSMILVEEKLENAKEKTSWKGSEFLGVIRDFAHFLYIGKSVIPIRYLYVSSKSSSWQRFS